MPETATTRERSEWAVTHRPLRKTVYGGMELIRWRARRSDIETGAPSAPWWAQPIASIAIWTLLLFVFAIVVIVELIRFVAGKLGRLFGPDPKPEKSDGPAPLAPRDDDGPRDLVVLTATGVVVEGRFCGVWSAGRQGLEKIELRESRGRYWLHLEFRRRGSITLPVPSELTNDMREVVTLLENKTYDARS